MTPGADLDQLFIGWDVGGWNCDKNPTSRDALVVLHAAGMSMVGQNKLAVKAWPMKERLT